VRDGVCDGGEVASSPLRWLFAHIVRSYIGALAHIVRPYIGHFAHIVRSYDPRLGGVTRVRDDAGFATKKAALCAAFLCVRNR
jgi:hypothetical protein